MTSRLNLSITNANFMPVIAAPSAIQLVSSPIPKAWVIAGAPEAFGSVVSRSADHAMTVVVWSCTTGDFEWHYEFDEVAQFLSGEVFLTGLDGVERRVTAGDTVVFTAGSKCIWRVTRDVRKMAVCRLPVPKFLGFGLRAWNCLFRLLRKPAHASALASPKG
jgi:uncharacterized cupin superfamily protein